MKKISFLNSQCNVNHQKTIYQCTDWLLPRFGKGPSQHLLYSIELNKKRQAYLTQWNAQTKEILKFRLLHGKAVTAFAVSPKGDMLGYGTADGGVGIVSATNLRRLFYDKKAHGFTVTCAAFSNDGKNLMSGSADYSCRIYSTRSLRGGNIVTQSLNLI